MNFPFHYELNHFFGSISETRILGFIPLGMILHVSISALITIVLLKRGMRFRNVFIIVFTVGLTKEILDCFVINNTMKKHILDMCYDMSYPTFLLLKNKMGIAIGKYKSKYQ